MDLTVYMAVIKDPGVDVVKNQTRGACRSTWKVAGQMIVKPDEEECLDCLGSYSEDVPCG